MNLIYNFTLVFLLLSFSGVGVSAGHSEIEDVYANPLKTYTKEGKKEKYSITDKTQIIGQTIGERTTRNLVEIKIDNKPVWVRASQLKLSQDQLAKCPDAAPGRAADRTTPVSSGMGGRCEK